MSLKEIIIETILCDTSSKTNMATPMHLRGSKVISNLLNSHRQSVRHSLSSHLFSKPGTRCIHTKIPESHVKGFLSKYRRGVFVSAGGLVGFSVGYGWVSQNKHVFAAEQVVQQEEEQQQQPPPPNTKPEHRISREVSPVLKGVQILTG